MGFGLICAGYSALLYMRLIPAEIIGFIVIFRGLTKLRLYNKYFDMARKSAVSIIAFSALDTLYWLLKYTKIIDSALIENIFTYAHRLIFIPFYLLLFMALRTISDELGFEKGVKRSSRAISVTVVYYLVFALSRLNIPQLGKYLLLFDTVMYIVLFLCTEFTVYTCYKAITTDEAEKREEEKLKKFDERFGRKKKSTASKEKNQTVKGTTGTKRK